MAGEDGGLEEISVSVVGDRIGGDHNGGLGQGNLS